MFDPIAQGMGAVSARSAYAPLLVFAAGAVTSIGPCVAPRFIAVAGLAAGKSRRQTVMLVASFIGGLTSTYAAFGAVTSLLGRATQLSAYTYSAVALALAAGGVVTLWRDRAGCGGAHGYRLGFGCGGTLLLGASFALVVSPCCTPLVLAILTYTSAAGSVAYGSILLACFALGHAFPIAAVAFGTHGITRLLQRHSVQQAAAMVSGTLMLGLAGLYAVLA
jgi:cytochrome c-type biogenesis protein